MSSEMEDVTNAEMQKLRVIFNERMIKNLRDYRAKIDHEDTKCRTRSISLSSGRPKKESIIQSEYIEGEGVSMIYLWSDDPDSKVTIWGNDEYSVRASNEFHVPYDKSYEDVESGDIVRQNTDKYDWALDKCLEKTPNLYLGSCDNPDNDKYIHLALEHPVNLRTDNPNFPKDKMFVLFLMNVEVRFIQKLREENASKKFYGIVHE